MKLTLTERLWASVTSDSTLTNEAAKEIERLEGLVTDMLSFIEVATALLEDDGEPDYIFWQRYHGLVARANK